MIPTIETENLILRAPRADDLDHVAAFMQSPRSSFIGGPKNRHETWRLICGIVGHWYLKGFGMWTLEHRAQGRACGAAGFIDHEGWDEPELGWHLHDGFEGQGLAYEGAKAARDYGQKHFGLNGVISYIDPKNTRSLALARRLNANYERDGLVMGHACHVYRHPKLEVCA
jgi:RimJ/RimL family protein N-acetyltransferase